MIPKSTNKLKVIFRYGLQLCIINVVQVFLAYVIGLALVLMGDGKGTFFPFLKKVCPKT